MNEGIREASREPHLERGMRVRLRGDLSPSVYGTLRPNFIPGSIYVILQVDRHNDGPSVVWIGPDTFSREEIDAFTQNGKQTNSLYDDVLPVAATYVRPLLQ